MDMGSLIIGFIIAAIVAGIVVAVLYGQMKPVAQKHEAAMYTKDEDVHVRVKDDVYLRTDVTRTKIQQSQPQANAKNTVIAPGAGPKH